MKKISKKIVSIVLVVILAFSATTMTFAANSITKASLAVSANKAKYSWNENIDFTVTVSNTGEQSIDYATVNITPEFSKYFTIQSSNLTVTNLPVGESKEISISLKPNCNSFLRIFMPIIKLFGIGKTSGYNSKNYDATSSIKVGAVKFEFGFNVGLGYENTATGKEIENLKKLNGNELPDTYMDVEDGIPSFIDGAFSNDTISNESDALHSLEDIQKLMGFENVENELDFYQKDSYGNNTFYRFQQYYNGIEVYGKNVIVVTDKNKKTSAMSNDYEPGISLNTTPTIDENKALNVAKSYISNCNNANVVGLRIYATDMDPTLVYMVYCNGTYEDTPFSGYVFVDANLGYAVALNNTVKAESVAEKIDVTVYSSQKISISNNFWKNNSQKIMCDITRKNIAFQVSNINSIDITDCIVNNNLYNSTINPNHNPITTSSSTWTQRQISLYSCLNFTSDYYLNNYGRKGFDGKNNPTFLVIEQGGSVRNAWANTVNNSCAYICYGTNYDPALDVVVHEYTHNVESQISSMNYHGESGALMEAYSDIMGEIVENDTTWMHFTNRDLANPSNSGKPSKYKGLKWASTTGGDNGGVHTNNTVVAHAAYLMQKDKITDMNKLGELWYRSMHYLDMNSTFEDCRAAVIAAARDMNMNNSEISCIKSSFDEVGIEGSYLGTYGFSSISGKVLDSSTMRPIAGAQVICLKTAPNEWGAGIVETDTNGNFKVTGLSSGTYEVSVSAPGYRAEFRYDVKIGAFSDITLSTSILLDASLILEGAVGGRITNAINGNAINDATIKFRKNHGVKTGSYVSKNGSDITIKTDGNGKYSYKGLTTGYYTMEVSKDGYITGYFDIIAAPSNEICQNQNFSISPELPEGQYRIVLTWGQNPRDLDSHITGVTSSGSSFHVYFSNMNAWDGDVHVVNLDIDDTSSYGPETVTLIPTTSETYRYYVYRYAGSGSISTSSAHIEVYKGNSLIATYDAPTNQGTGDYWTVFEITNGTIKTVNKIGNSVFSS